MSQAREPVTINYGETLLSTGLSAGQVLFDLQPADTPPVRSVAHEIHKALNQPVGSAPLRDLVSAGKRVVVIGDDNTRLTPTAQIIPPVLDELNAGGVADSDITLIIATGTHRPMTVAEIASKYGDSVTSRVRVVNHNCLDLASLVECGTTRRGTDIWINRMVLEADVRVGVGNIVPHHPTGWSAGAKILLPGVAGERTTAQMHLLGATEQQLGKVDTPCREEMEDYAEAAGLDFIINTVLNRQGEITRVVAGHFVAAHREGVRWAKKVYGAPFGQKADITLSSTFPIDHDLFQADKGLFSAAVCTKVGGEIILVSPCYEGISPTHPEVVELGCLSDKELWELASAECSQDPLSIAEVLYFNSLKQPFKVTLATEGISREMAGKMGFHHIEPGKLADYLAERLEAEQEVTVGILRHGTETLPLHQVSTHDSLPEIPTAGLRLWLAADSGITASDGTVSRWADMSGNGPDAVQEHCAYRPTLLVDGLDGKPALRFDGLDDFMRFSPLELNGLSGMTVALVSTNWKFTTSPRWGREGGDHGTTNAALLFEETGESGSWGCVYLSPFQKSVTFRFGTGQEDNCPRWVRPGTIHEGFSVSVVTKGGGAEKLYVDGEMVCAVAGKRTEIANTGSEGWLGRGRVDTFGPFTISEVLIYDRALPKAELRQLHHYLKTKYFGGDPAAGD